jgi:hypothetical protein
MDVYWLFDWLDTSLLADMSKAYGGVFAVVQMFHLLGLALMGGSVILSDLRLLGVVMTDVPSKVVFDNTQKLFTVSLIVLVVSGIFMASAVALKLYYNEAFWAKMTGLALGTLFVYLIRKPLFTRFEHDTISPAAVKVTAICSLTIWFTVAASGRWIGFS